MKKILALISLLLLLLCGCSSEKIISLTDPSFQYSEADQAYVLQFALGDQAGSETASSGKLSVVIEDEKGSLLYEGKIKFSEDDFVRFHNPVSGDHCRAQIKIPQDQVMPGMTLSGTVKFSVKKTFGFSFQNQHCEAAGCLPLKPCEIHCDQLGKDLKIVDPFWHTETVYRIDNLESGMDPYLEGNVNIRLQGQKLEGTAGEGADMIRYRVLDSQGNPQDGGELYLGKFHAGDSFQANLTLYSLIPGESYSLSFGE